MKIRMYIDLWKGVDPSRNYITATNQPSAKSEGYRRIAFDVTIPDSLVYEVDVLAPEVYAVEEVK